MSDYGLQLGVIQPGGVVGNEPGGSRGIDGDGTGGGNDPARLIWPREAASAMLCYCHIGSRRRPLLDFTTPPTSSKTPCGPPVGLNK